jgi:signal recognition particle GTPase
MFKMTERLSRTVQQLRGKGRLTEAASETLREVRIALLSDVALPVAAHRRSKEKALGQKSAEPDARPGPGETGP